MADDRVVSEIVTKFFLNISHLREQLQLESIVAMCCCAQIITRSNRDYEGHVIPLTTGSVAELYIRPMLPCLGDIDIMAYCSRELAIPAGTPPPTQLPAEFHNRVTVCEILDSEFPGYVYLVGSYLLTECIDDGMYKAVQYPRAYASFNSGVFTLAVGRHGPAMVHQLTLSPEMTLSPEIGFFFASRTGDVVPCTRCLSWPSQAADWPSRHREYGWPDSATVDCVVSNGCDVVPVAHPQCQQDESVSKYQWRLSFSRAEIALLNS